MQEMTPYTVGVLRDFVTRHFLIGGDWGKENDLHSHHYRMEAIFGGDELDRHGYLLDISVVEKHLDNLVDRYREKILNELPEFAGKNPSLEFFARALAEGMSSALGSHTLRTLTVKLWEHETAFASFTIRYR